MHYDLFAYVVALLILYFDRNRCRRRFVDGMRGEFFFFCSARLRFIDMHQPAWLNELNASLLRLEFINSVGHF